MARVSVVGNGNGKEERSNNPRLPKQPRISITVSGAHRNSNSAANASISAAAQTPTERELPPDNPIAAEKEPESESGEESFTLIDPSVFDCPICFEPLSSPVYQCENGHIACAPCCIEMAKKCPSCRLPIEHSRSRAIEKVLESVQFKCRNMMYGCMEKIHYSKRFGHESTCIYAPCSCPEIDCDYVGMSKCLYKHFGSQHPQHSRKFCFDLSKAILLYADSKHAFLIEVKDNILFILNRSIESVGSYVNVVCVAPATTKTEYLYKLTASDAERKNSVKLETHVQCMPKWMPGDPASACLLVPRDFESPGGMLILELIITRNSAPSVATLLWPRSLSSRHLPVVDNPTSSSLSS